MKQILETKDEGSEKTHKTTGINRKSNQRNSRCADMEQN